MACGAGIASVALIDFIHQLIKSGIIQRQSPLTISFVLNDLNESCVTAAGKSLQLVKQILLSTNRNIMIGSVMQCTGSVSEVLPFLRDSSFCCFNFLFLCNAFDQILVHGHRALEKNPYSTDPIVHARPCDRPSLLADLLQQLGVYSDSYFSRVILLQESRNFPLISVTLPSHHLRITRTWMVQETDRPDVDKPTLNVRFGYFGGRYGFTNKNFCHTPELLPFISPEIPVASFTDDSMSQWFDENDTTTSFFPNDHG